MISNSSSSSTSSSTIFKISATAGGGGGGGGFTSSWRVMGMISSSTSMSSSWRLKSTLTSVLVHSKATRTNESTTTRPICRKTVFLLSRSALGVFLTSITNSYRSEEHTSELQSRPQLVC